MPTDDAPTTSEWSTILLRFYCVLEVWWYIDKLALDFYNDDPIFASVIFNSDWV